MVKVFPFLPKQEGSFQSLKKPASVPRLETFSIPEIHFLIASCLKHKKRVCKARMLHVCLITTCGPDDWFSHDTVRILCGRKPRQHRTFKFTVILNRNMADTWTCDTGALALTHVSLNMQLSRNIPADAGFLFDKAAACEDTIKRIL